ncbi:hypothetical protein Fmac_031675 [Flemingia macrophylla]|uniref:SGTA homodimerisation domain-containing protein n=1 Tax=Flemingia macrophylla TaxID=520843 RepID=A0ABD1L2R0_9FABA
MAHNHIPTDSPLSRRIVRAFLHFLNSVEPSPGVDVEGIEVARDCLTEAFKLNTSLLAGDTVQFDSLIDIFKSLEANKICDASKSDVGPPRDSAAAASSSFSRDPVRGKNHSEASKSVDEDSTQGTHVFESKDELCEQFFAALDKNHYFGAAGLDDPEQQEKACRLFDNVFMEMERSGCYQLSLKSMAESLKSLGNKAMQSKHYSHAIDLYNGAIALYEKSAVYYCNRAAAYTQINKYTEAIQDCLRSIEIDPNYSKAYSRLGMAYYAQGNYRDAIDKGFRKALQLDPNSETVKENIRVAEGKLSEDQVHNQNPRPSQEFPYQSSQGSRSQAAPPPFSSMQFNPSDLANMFMNIAPNATNAHQGSHAQNPGPSQEFPNQSAQGSRSQAVPPPFSSVQFNPNDFANMFRNIAPNATNAHQGLHGHVREEDTNNGGGAREPEIRIGGNISVNLDQMPGDLPGAVRSMMEMLSGAVPPGQQDQMSGRRAPN